MFYNTIHIVIHFAQNCKKNPKRYACHLDCTLTVFLMVLGEMANPSVIVACHGTGEYALRNHIHARCRQMNWEIKYPRLSRCGTSNMGCTDILVYMQNIPVYINIYIKLPVVLVMYVAFDWEIVIIIAHTSIFYIICMFITASTHFKYLVVCLVYVSILCSKYMHMYQYCTRICISTVRIHFQLHTYISLMLSYQYAYSTLCIIFITIIIKMHVKV